MNTVDHPIFLFLVLLALIGIMWKLLPELIHPKKDRSSIQKCNQSTVLVRITVRGNTRDDDITLTFTGHAKSGTIRPNDTSLWEHIGPEKRKIARDRLQAAWSNTNALEEPNRFISMISKRTQY